MKKSFYAIILLALTVLGLGYATYRLTLECKALEKKASQLENTAANIGQAPQSSTVVKTDKGDITVVSSEPMKVTDKVIKTRYPEEMKVAKSASDVRPKDVDGISHIEVSTRDSVKAPVNVEPFGELSTHYEDEYATIDVRIDSTNTASIGYEVRDSIVIVEWARRHSILFGLIKWKTKSRVEAYSKNPKAQVKSVEVLQRLE